MTPPLREPFHSMARAVFFWDLDLGVPRRESETCPPKRGARLRRRRPVRTPVAASPIRHATNGMLPRERALASLVLRSRLSCQRQFGPVVSPNLTIHFLHVTGLSLSCPSALDLSLSSPKGRRSPQCMVQYQPSFDQMRSFSHAPKASFFSLEAFQPHSERELLPVFCKCKWEHNIRREAVLTWCKSQE